MLDIEETNSETDFEENSNSEEIGLKINLERNKNAELKIKFKRNQK